MTAAARLALPSPPRLAYLSDFPWTQLDCDADDTLDAAATRLRTAGAEIVPVALPAALHEAARVHRTIMLYEAARNLGGLQERARAHSPRRSTPRSTRAGRSPLTTTSARWRAAPR